MQPAPEQELEAVFPGLVGAAWEIASPRDPTYNCVAFALGDTDRWWWPLALPASAAHWPEDVPRAETVEAVASMLATLGFAPTDDESPSDELWKVALYAKGART